MQPAHSTRVLVAAFPVTPEVVGRAVAVSEAVLNKCLFASAPVHPFEICFAETALGKDVLTRDNPYLSPAVLNTLDARGIVKVGTQVRCGDVLVSKLAPKSKVELSAEEKLLHAILGKGVPQDMRNDSLEYTYLDPGQVVSVQLKARKRGQCSQCGDVFAGDEKCPHCSGPLENVQSDEFQKKAVRMEVAIEVMICRNLAAGDVLEDDQGNHVVVAQIVPEPQAEPPIDMWVHPDSRLAARLQRREIVHHESCRVDHLEFRKTTLRLEDKVRARATGPYSLIAQMPLGKYFPGQLVRQDTAQALFLAGYRQNLLEMLTIKSDAVEGRRLANEASLKGKDIPWGVPESTYNLASYLKALGIILRLSNRRGDVVQPVELDEGADPRQELLLEFAGASAADIRGWSFGEVKKSETLNYRTYRPESDGLFCERIFGPEKDWECACGKYRGMKHKGTVCDQCGVKITTTIVRRRRMGHIELAAPMVHSWFLTADAGLARLLDMSREDLGKLVDYRAFVVTDPGSTGLTRKQLLNQSEHDSLREKHGPDAFKAGMGGEAVRQLLRAENPACNNLDWIVLETIPVLPPDLRPLVLLSNGNFATSDLNDLYLRLINRNNVIKKLVQLKAPGDIIANEKRVLQECVDSLFDNRSMRSPIQGDNHKRLVSLTDLLIPTLRELGEKRTDYSARGVVIPDSTLKAGTAVGLPAAVVQVLFKLWATRLTHSLGKASSIKGAAKWLDQQGQSPQCLDLYRQVLSGHPVLVIADTQRFVGLQPVIVEGEVIRLHPDDAKKLGILFDGEQITVHVPLSRTAVEELSDPRPNPDTSSILGELNPNSLVDQLAIGHHCHRLTPYERVLLGIDRGSSPAIRIPPH